MNYITLNDGNMIPAVGFGVFMIPADGSTYKAVLEALKVGYRHIDTAAAYFNEAEVGKAVRDSGIPREKIFITSKLWLQDYGYEAAKKGIDVSLSKLGLDYIDLYLLHQPYGDVEGAWKALEEAKAEDKIKSIGVSNMTPKLYTELTADFATKPAVNQVECNPLFQQKALRKVLAKDDVKLEAWYPLGHGDKSLLENPAITTLAEKYCKNAGQIDYAHSLRPKIHEYYAARKKLLGLSEMGIYDLYTAPCEINYGEVDYDTCVNLGREAISVWGDEYLEKFDQVITSNHVDVFPTDTKQVGAYCSLAGNSTLPFVMFNFDNQLSYTSTIVHEMGHAVYDCFSAENQNTYNCTPSIFTHEVTSTANELMFEKYMSNHAASDQEALYWVDQEIDLFIGTIVTQCMYSELEDYCYKTIEAGGALSAEDVSAKFLSLMKDYYGDAVVIDDYKGDRWATIPHFYYGYYVYQYATSMTYATSICNKVEKDEAEKSAYLEFLKAGNTASPAELLKTAGVDPYDDKTYDDAKTYFDTLVDDFVKLAG